jgi:hypothetical protein
MKNRLSVKILLWLSPIFVVAGATLKICHVLFADRIIDAGITFAISALICAIIDNRK